jgi:dinuclear metal center YbgI/SA1388 family protein
VTSLWHLIDHCDALLKPHLFSDYGPNGLQVPGAETVDTVATGVSASVELFERAAAEGAQLVLVHHGLFWGAGAYGIDKALHRRLKPLFAHGMALAAYHLPLDGHPEIGNNALLAQGLGATDPQPFAEHKGMPIGIAARFPEPIGAEELADRVRQLTNQVPLHLAYGPERIASIGIVSGGASDYLADAVAAGHDAFLTGEPAERVMTQAREAGIHFLAGGHYATETFGIRALGERLSQRFEIRHVFIDDPNPI